MFCASVALSPGAPACCPPLPCRHARPCRAHVHWWRRPGGRGNPAMGMATDPRIRCPTHDSALGVEVRGGGGGKMAGLLSVPNSSRNRSLSSEAHNVNTQQCVPLTNELLRPPASSCLDSASALRPDPPPVSSITGAHVPLCRVPRRGGARPRARRGSPSGPLVVRLRAVPRADRGAVLCRCWQCEQDADARAAPRSRGVRRVACPPHRLLAPPPAAAGEVGLHPLRGAQPAAGGAH